MKYFNDCTTAEELKKAYHKAAAQLHPDNGGSEDEFKKMQGDYTAAFSRLKFTHKTASGETYQKETQETAAEFMDIIDKIIHMEGAKIEIIGSWIWVSGNTMIHKETLKNAGFWWSKAKKAWYYNGEKEYKRRRGNYTMKKLREKWGTREIDPDPRPYLT